MHNVITDKHIDTSDSVLNARVKLIKKFVLPTCLLNPIYASLLAYGLWTSEFALYLTLWASAVSIMGGIWFFLYRAFDTNLLSAKKFIQLSAVAAGISGFTWGSIGFWAVEASFTAPYLYVSFFLVIINTAPYLALGTIPKLQNSFIVSCLIPLIANPFYYGITDMYWMSMIVCFLLLGFIFYGNQHAQMIENTIQLSHENKLLTQQVIQEKEEVERASAAKTRFLAAASHDLRQPLQAQHFFVGALKTAKNDAQKDKLINNLQDSTIVLGNLLNSLLDISKLDANVVPTQIKIINLNSLLIQILNEFTPMAQKNGLKLRVINTHYCVKSDPVLLENIIRNLVSNAIRYSFKGHVLIACSQAHEHQFTLEVRDTGIGIAKEKLPFIFDEFYQIGNDARDRDKGLGLGLSIVTRLCKLLGHKISVDKQRFKGSRFYLSLVTEDSVAPQTALSSEELMTLKGKTLLIIDDDPIILESLANLLDQWHCGVIPAESESQAIERSKGIKIDGIIADYRLKNKKTGSDAIFAIREAHKQAIPAVLLTGETSPQQLRTLDNTEFLVLHKPIQPASLRAAINNLLVSNNT